MAVRKAAATPRAEKASAVKKTAVKKTAVKKTAVNKSAAKRPAVARSATTTPPKTATKNAPQSMPYEQGKWAHVFARQPGERRYWLMKSEPDVFSFQHLQAAPKQTTSWDSVRNSGARNFLRDGMKKGDLAFYYHSNADPSAIVGICEVVREGYPDPTALDATHDYFDPASVAETPTWFMVDVQAVEALPRPVTLPEIKASDELQEMALLKVSRLSVVPVTPEEWATVLRMSRQG
jgi:predicted RNA-binding protein with PUA-like domain